MGGVFFRGNQVFLKRVLCFVKRLTSCHVIFQLGYMIYDMSTFYMSFERKKNCTRFYLKDFRALFIVYLHNYNALKIGVLQILFKRHRNSSRTDSNNRITKRKEGRKY